jgi:hypothetical protein
MTWYPKYRLYASNGTSLLYTFNYITNDNSPQDPVRFTEISGSRGQGSIIVEGSSQAWDISLDFVLVGTGYQDLISQMDSLESTIVPHTAYVLKIDRTPSTTVDYNVKRITPIRWDSSKRLTLQRGNITFRALTW